jgi:hypothetical protein
MEKTKPDARSKAFTASEKQEKPAKSTTNLGGTNNKIN